MIPALKLRYVWGCTSKEGEAERKNPKIIEWTSTKKRKKTVIHKGYTAILGMSYFSLLRGSLHVSKSWIGPPALVARVVSMLFYRS